MNNGLSGAYTRLELPQARVTPAESLLILRDIHNRLKELEDKNEKDKDSTRGRGTNKVPKGKVSSH